MPGRGSALFACGWCVSPGAPVRELELVLDGEAVPVRAQGMPRGDVLETLSPDPPPGSLMSGFWGMVDTALKRRRLKRRVVASVPMFMTAMTTAAQTDLVATIPSRLAAKHARQLGLRVFEAPLKVDPFTISLVRHARSAGDPGLDWLATRIVQAGQG